MTGKKDTYEDMLSLPHHVSDHHAQMTAMERAAQFSPFAALSGHADAIKETERLTDERILLSEDEKRCLDRRLGNICREENLMKEVSVTYFVPDTLKAGGRYVTVRGRIEKLDTAEHKLTLSPGVAINCSDITHLELETEDEE